MEDAYYKFLEQSIKELDMYIIDTYNEYVSNPLKYIKSDILFENSEEWFEHYVNNFINGHNYPSWIDKYQLLPLNRYNNFIFEKELVSDYTDNDVYLDSIIDKNDERGIEYCVKQTINKNFINEYKFIILDFEYFKRILYENGIYNEVFADNVVELK